MFLVFFILPKPVVYVLPQRALWGHTKMLHDSLYLSFKPLFPFLSYYSLLSTFPVPIYSSTLLYSLPWKSERLYFITILTLPSVKTLKKAIWYSMLEIHYTKLTDPTSPDRFLPSLLFLWFWVINILSWRLQTWLSPSHNGFNAACSSKTQTRQPIYISLHNPKIQPVSL
jgi:hypothetical protein